MLKIQEIREIIRLIDQSSIEEFLYEHDGVKVHMKKPNGSVPVEAVAKAAVVEPAPVAVVKEAAPQVEAAPAVPETKPAEAPKQEAVKAENLHKITSPMVGTFYAAPSPDAAPYVKTGDKVKPNTVVCIIEAMKLFNEIEAEVNGEIVEILVQNGQLVEYGQPLFLVKTE
ncbi:acetyl-CoA carboxylase biotin carboxyl carrier protein [Anoxybacillus rupiensis]|jgi:acetyl-CoA carboxylase biotin carboxyl carrier protein|uniref:Biotin carboxyl carrier protein of acetyl-CoA carboxylase n=1 Tax=Anoxybacteroides rupiense TaxID=311460 RepID=A0ABT5W202_9BACL|nr:MULTISPECIES: acetyl-CoA carboxylase biotin carboxyl carrier protein [Anoxybacillus]KXG11223.1 Biotin carboxyl carrier protein of acetyl-CoA carboxylase [Anoxybacillus sp. P3H1B]MBS2770088.1 acetyl-CoA carboxylase biotin carboxyl carrier protein [Anoxybacillus rupiensis]MDE8562540.1 acetyl-CoA carboxylase biotin carboxyl carrier protein [Anoxybacillus rupiensis]